MFPVLFFPPLAFVFLLQLLLLASSSSHPQRLAIAKVLQALHPRCSGWEEAPALDLARSSPKAAGVPGEECPWRKKNWLPGNSVAHR